MPSEQRMERNTFVFVGVSGGEEKDGSMSDWVN